MSEYGHNDNLNSFQDFIAVDKALIDIGVSSNERLKIYKTLAAILHLGNVAFEENPSLEGCQIVDITRKHIEYAAEFLNIEQNILETSLLTRKMEVKGSDPIV